MTRTIINRRTVTLAGILFVAGTFAVTFAQSSPATAEAQTRGSDVQFVKNAAEGGMAEVKLGELATHNGDNTTVKDFGKRMINDHTAANDKLKAIASKDGITVPSDLSARDRATYERLSKLQGAAFDKAYARLMVKDHQEDIAEFKHEANSDTNREVKMFASDTLPTLEEHFRLAQAMLREVTGGTSSGTALKPSSK